MLLLRFFVTEKIILKISFSSIKNHKIITFAKILKNGEKRESTKILNFR